MKKILALLLAALFVFVFSACKSKDSTKDNKDNKSDLQGVTEYSEGNNQVDWNPEWTTQIEENK